MKYKYKDKQKENQKRQRERNKKPLRIGICIVCNKEFKTNKFNKECCSKKCAYSINLKKQRKKQQEKNNHSWKNPKICKECKKEYIPKVSHQKFCSEKCQKEYNKKKYEKETKGIIKNKSKSYNFLRLRFEIFKRDNFICQYCGRNPKEDKIKIVIEHIIARVNGGKDTADNLTTSCEDCNMGKGDVLLTERKLERRRKNENENNV